MEIGWDYSLAKPNGRNVFFFRDTDHTSGAIQQLLLDELEQKLVQSFFSTVFIEGAEGVYKPWFMGYSSEDELKNDLGSRFQRWSVAELSAYRFRGWMALDQFLMYGVDSDDLRKESITTAKEILRFRERDSSGETFSDEELKRWQSLFSRRKTLVSERSRFSAGMIDTLMSGDLLSAGVIYGDAHYQEMVDRLQDSQIGCISYFPGVPVRDSSRIRTYIEKL